MSGIVGSHNIRGSGLVKKLTVDGIDDDAVTLAKLVAGTDGNLISYDTSGDPVTVAAGTDGQVLTSAGAGAVCLFEDAAAGGVTMYDSYHIDGVVTGPTSPVTGWTRLTNTSDYGIIGSAMSESSGTWTFPSTGIYRVEFQQYIRCNDDDNQYGGFIQVTTNNSTYNDRSNVAQNAPYSVYSSNSDGGITCSIVIDVTSTTNVKVRFRVAANNDSTDAAAGTSWHNGGASGTLVRLTGVSFEKLADT